MTGVSQPNSDFPMPESLNLRGGLDHDTEVYFVDRQHAGGILGLGILLMALPPVIYFTVEIHPPAGERWVIPTLVAIALATITVSTYMLAIAIRDLRDFAPKLEFNSTGIIDHRDHRMIDWRQIANSTFSSSHRGQRRTAAVITLSVAQCGTIQAVKVDVRGLSASPESIFERLKQFFERSEKSVEPPISSEKSWPDAAQATIYFVDKVRAWTDVGFGTFAFFGPPVFWFNFLLHPKHNDRLGMSFLGLVALGMMGAGVFFVYRGVRALRDHSPQLEFNSTGVVDYRGSAQFEWSSVRNAVFLERSGEYQKHQAFVTFTVGDGEAAKEVKIDVCGLSASPISIFERFKHCSDGV